MKGINLLSRHIQIALYSCTLLTSTALAREVTFSTDILNTRGISKNIANYFAEEPRFLPGVHSVLINVNGSEKGSLGAKFDEQGQLCVDDDFLTAIGLRPLGISLQEHCHDLQKDYPSAVIKSLPGKEMLELTRPTHWKIARPGRKTIATAAAPGCSTTACFPREMNTTAATAITTRRAISKRAPIWPTGHCAAAIFCWTLTAIAALKIYSLMANTFLKRNRCVSRLGRSAPDRRCFLEHPSAAFSYSPSPA